MSTSLPPRRSATTSTGRTSSTRSESDHGLGPDKLLTAYQKLLDPARRSELLFPEIWGLHQAGYIGINLARKLAGLDTTEEQRSPDHRQLRESVRRLRETLLQSGLSLAEYLETPEAIKIHRVSSSMVMRGAELTIDSDEPASSPTSSPSTAGTTSPSTPTSPEPSSSSTSSDSSVQETGRASSFVSLREIGGFY